MQFHLQVLDNIRLTSSRISLLMKSENRTTGQSASPTNSATSSSAFLPVVTNSTDGTPPVKFSEAQNAQMAAHNETLAQFMKPKFARAPITEAGRVAYLGLFQTREKKNGF